MEAQQKYHQENPQAREHMSDIKKKYYEEHPGARQKCGEAQKKRYENPEEIKKNSERMKKYYENNPDARRKASKVQPKPFDVFTTNGSYINTFAYQFEAKEYLQKEYNITSTVKISEVLAGNRNTSVGFVFKYK